MPHFIRMIELPVTPEVAFRWHERPGAFSRLLPPWQRVEILEAKGGIRDGGQVKLRLRRGPIDIPWALEHCRYEFGRRFCDEQRSGPFGSWRHEHRFLPGRAPGGCRLEDDIEFSLPGGSLGNLLGEGLIQRDLHRLFAYRHAVTREDLVMHQTLNTQESMTIAVTGASGLVGTAVSGMLTTGGHRLLRLVRRDGPPADDEVRWDAEQGVHRDDLGRLEGLDAVIHLAGAGIADKRWSEERKREIRDSRVVGTAKLAESLLRLEQPPRAFVGASAIGYYGSRGDEELDEDSTSGEGFLAEVTRQWEEASAPLAEKGVRVALGRTGVVLSPAGGALKAMLPAFKMGLGGPVGGGRQWVSWISIDDVAAALLFLAIKAELSGVFNLVAPNPVRQADFAKALGRALHRPSLAPAPALALKLMFGQMAEETVLASIRVRPRRLTEAGFSFRHPELDQALGHVLGADS
ncbi:MAG: TIGR01777 family oxidoreductase [Phycisphaeraceae bacterium]|nr:TIGR01777 family oxidoreductase [Phycisphaeraceae bacterium]